MAASGGTIAPKTGPPPAFVTTLRVGPAPVALATAASTAILIGQSPMRRRSDSGHSDAVVVTSVVIVTVVVASIGCMIAHGGDGHSGCIERDDVVGCRTLLT